MDYIYLENIVVELSIPDSVNADSDHDLPDNAELKLIGTPALNDHRVAHVQEVDVHIGNKLLVG